MAQDGFFDRTYYLDTLKKRVTSLLEGYRQNIALIGDELIGKTSVIFKFLESYTNNRLLFIYMEARQESTASFARRFIGVLLYNFLANSGSPLKEDMDYLLNKSDRYIPRTILKVRAVLSAIEKRKKNNIFTELLSLTDSIYLETGKSCIVILDEFHNLESLKIKGLYREWAKLLITQKNTLYIIVSSLKWKTKNILSKDLSLLFGNFEVITVEPFDIKTSECYLEQKLGCSELNAALKSFLVHFTGGYPFYLEVISSSIIKSEGRRLAEILEEMLFNASGILNQRFSNYIKRFQDIPNSNDYLSILYLISSGRNKLKDIYHILRKQKKEVAARVTRLLETDTISKNGDFLKINDRVFCFWLRFVYQGRLQSLSFGANNQKTRFRESIEGMIEEFAVSSRKPITERVSELCRLFEDETMQVERKNIRLSHFREVKPMEFGNKKLKEWLVCRSSGSLWLIAFKKDLLTEEDITEFIRECKKYKSKLQQKIIVTLSDIDQNTRLKAMEEKVWTWDINSMNQMLDLFSKPRVVG